MSEKSNPTAWRGVESQANGSPSTPAEEHKVGPGRPPRTRSGRKAVRRQIPVVGRGRAARVIPDLGKAFEQAISKKVGYRGAIGKFR